MIQIQDHLNRSDARAFLKKLATEHWEYLNPKKKDGNYYVYSLISLCDKYFKESATKAYRTKYAVGIKAAAKRQRKFFQFLIDDDNSRLKQLVISSPSGFSKIRSEIFKILRCDDIFTVQRGKLVQTPFGKLLTETIFSYGKFRRSSYCTDLFGKLGLSSAFCPYCNDNKISIVEITNNLTSSAKKKAYFEIDHFFSKVENPFLAVTFFNLIPTCHSCNGSDKGDKTFSIHRHIHPYLNSFDDFFDFKLNQLITGKPGDKIVLSFLRGTKFKSFIKDLNLEDRYQSNLDRVNELADLYFKYQNRIGTSDESFFVEMMLRDVPRNKFDIMRYDKGKMKRDVLRHLDKGKKVLGL